ncbi:Hcp family type VI secretion system effector [Bosea sp. PAMC 26642]|uniref:Hcp family type VI secretion system effector n=1 Tax=Bosea sp. (strain PAMC 26642) TaxID=1792307 RepID=UPI0007703DB0|nr:type VI secretion system tube protein Hcp [Bosea sp. PAMC 26642]AMJ62815.1 Hcp1 family type VI secretion system effector [Bosea sp. PAMC 26642]
MASDFLLELDGIKGESQDSKHKDFIEIESFSWGASNSGSHASGGGGGAGKVSFQDLHFTTKVNKASPNLMVACATGQHIKKAKLVVRKHGGEQQEYYVISLDDLLVSSYQSGDAVGGDTIPTDQFSLNFSKIKFEYKPQKADGSLDAAITGGYDVKTNKKL